MLPNESLLEKHPGLIGGRFIRVGCFACAIESKRLRAAQLADTKSMQLLEGIIIVL